MPRADNFQNVADYFDMLIEHFRKRRGEKMKRRKPPQRDWDEVILDICFKAIIPVAILWGIFGCIASVLYFLD